MKKPLLFFTTISLSALMLVSINSNKTGGSYIKNAWSEISYKEDSTLFLPYNKCWNQDWTIDGLYSFDYQNYSKAMEGNKSNLWNVMHEEIIIGNLPIYYPYNPDWFTSTDEGFLKYPFLEAGSTQNFANHREIRDDYAYALGLFGPESNFPLINTFGEDSTITDDFGNILTVYPPRDYYWFMDVDIIKYQIREDVVINGKGKEKSRRIKSLAPIVNKRDVHTGEILGEEALFWVSFDDLKPILEENFFIDQASGKVISYLDYFSKRMFKSSLVKEENFKVTKED